MKYSRNNSVMEYGDETTIHGVKELVTYQGVKKFLWLLSVLICLTFGAYEVYNIVQNYRYSDVVTKLTLNGVAPVELFVKARLKNKDNELIPHQTPFVPGGLYGKTTGNPNIDLYLLGYSFDIVLLDLNGSQGWNDSEIIEKGKAYVSRFSSVEEAMFSIMPNINVRIANTTAGVYKKIINVGGSENTAKIVAKLYDLSRLRGFELRKDFAEDLIPIKTIGFRRPGYLVKYPKITSLGESYKIKVSNSTLMNHDVYVTIMNTQRLRQYHLKPSYQIKLAMSFSKIKRLQSNCKPEFKTNVPFCELALAYRKTVIDRFRLQTGSADLKNPHYFYNSWELGLRNKKTRAQYARLKEEFTGYSSKVQKCPTCNLCEEYIVALDRDNPKPKKKHSSGEGTVWVLFKSGTASIIFEDVHQFTIDGAIANVCGIIGACCGLSLISIWHCLFYWCSKAGQKFNGSVTDIQLIG